MDTHDQQPVVTPRIGEEAGDVMEADIPGCYHLITAKQPTPIADTGYVTIFDSYPSWQMVGGRLMPMSEEEAQQAYLRWSAGAHQPHDSHADHGRQVREPGQRGARADRGWARRRIR